MNTEGYDMLVAEERDRRASLRDENTRLRAQVEALTQERNYWRSATEDPSVYWGEGNPPYWLPGHGDGQEHD